MTNETRKKLGTASLVIASFLNPFGYDLLVFKLTQLTNSYWHTMYILYFFTALFFTLFFILYRINPAVYLFNKVKSIITSIKLKING
jgi:hypothetical protein